MNDDNRNKKILKLIDDIKDFNTRQNVAIENNKPIQERIEARLTKIEKVDLKLPSEQKYKKEVEDIIASVRELLDGEVFDDYHQKKETHARVYEKLATIVDKIYDDKVAELNEFQQ